MQDVVALDLRGAVPRNQRERIQRDRRIADIGDVVLDGEEIALVDRNGAAEGEAVAIVVFQRHRAVRRKAVRSLPAATACSGRAAAPWSPRRRPSRIRRNRDAGVPEGENSTTAGDLGSTVVRNCTSARSSMRAPFSAMLPLTLRGVDLDARRRCDRGLAVDHRGRRGGLGSAGRWARMARRPAGWRARRAAGLRRRLGQLALGLLRRAAFPSAEC